MNKIFAIVDANNFVRHEVAQLNVLTKRKKFFFLG